MPLPWPRTDCAVHIFTVMRVPVGIRLPPTGPRVERTSLPSRFSGWWEPVNGAVEGGETLLHAAVREVIEKTGPDLRVRPLSVV